MDDPRIEAVLEVLSRDVFGTPIASWLAFGAVVVVTYLLARFVLWLLRRRLVRRADRAAENGGRVAGDAFLAMLDSTMRIALLGLGVLLGVAVVPDLPERLVRVARVVGLVVVFLQIGWWGSRFLDRGIRRGLGFLRVETDVTEVASGVLRFFGLVVLWACIALLILTNAGIEIAPLIAGLGLGGLAIAFALQKVLEDIFCSVAIVLDRPFQIGDFIIIGDEMGTVERVGIKSTRIRSLSGEMLAVSNADLLNTRIRNYRPMEERRVVFGFGVLYDSPPAKVARVGGWVREIIEGIEHARFDRAHFKGFGDSSLDFEIVYFVKGNDYVRYMDIQEKINLALFDKLAAEGLDFAFPTRTIRIASPRVEEIARLAGGGGRDGNGERERPEPSEAPPATRSAPS